MKTRFEAYGSGIEKGWLKPNEARYFENLDELDGLDVINFGLGAVLYDPNTKTYYTPNTGEQKGLNGGGKETEKPVEEEKQGEENEIEE